MANDLKKFNQNLTDQRTQEYLVKVLGEKKNSFVSNLTALVSNTKALQECEPMSTMYAALQATALDLPLNNNLGFAYVIPYNNRKTGTVESQFQLGYKAYIQLAIRSGQFKTINVREVKKGEIVGEDFVSGELTFQKLSDEERVNADTIGYVGYFRLTNGFEKMVYWTIPELKQHGLKYSQSYSSKNDYVRKSSLWETDFDAMAKKTVLKLMLSKYAPLSVDMQSAIIKDQAVIRGTLEENNIEEAQVEYVDNDPDAVKEEADTKILEQASQMSEEGVDIFNNK